MGSMNVKDLRNLIRDFDDETPVVIEIDGTYLETETVINSDGDACITVTGEYA